MRRVNELVTGQWPLAGLIAIALIFEFGYTYSSGSRGLPVLFCSLLATVIALLSPRRPGDAILGVAATILLSTAVTPFMHLSLSDYPMPGGVPAVQVLAGMGTVVNLVRAVGLTGSWPRIAALAGVVAIAATVNGERPGRLTDPSLLGTYTVAALLLLGISVAIGLAYSSSCDSVSSVQQVYQ